MYPYYRPIDIELTTEDWRFLNFLSHNYLADAKHPTYGEYAFTGYSHFFLRDADVDYSYHPIFKKISELFIDSPYSSVEHVYNWSQVSIVPDLLPIHIDVRKAVISIPLVTFTTPIIWYDENDNELYRYHYENTATLLNTATRHGSPDNNSSRIFFQVGGFHEPFEKIVTYLK